MPHSTTRRTVARLTLVPLVAACLGTGLPAAGTASADEPSPEPAPTSPHLARPDRLPTLTDQQREDLLSPGSVQQPVRPGTPMPQAGQQPRTSTTPPGDFAHANRYNACIGYQSFLSTNSRDQVLDDSFTWGTYGRYKVGDGTGDINWLANPFRHVSWYMWLHSLRWIGSAIEAGKNGDQRALTHAKAIARDWIKDNPYSWQSNIGAWESTMHRTNILLCLRQTITDRNDGQLPTDDRWLDDSLVQHVEYMKHHFSGHGNHGTDESLAMLGVAATLGRQDYLTLAQQRLSAILAAAIDADGATNEQSTGYAVFNYALWGRVGTEVATLLPGSVLDKQIRDKRRRLLTFLAHSFTPDATPFQIGNTEQARRAVYAGTAQEWPASGGTSGTPPRQRVGVFAASGYVFGRDTWGTNAQEFAASSAYSLRFGPARAKHGHHDHTALIWYADGSPVLIDPGFGEYTKDAWEIFAKSPQAHNQLVIGGMRDSVATKLTRRVLSPGTSGPMADYYQLVDAPGKGYTRIRDVIVLSDPEVVLVVDRATAPKRTTFSQLWHLPVGTTATPARVAAHATSADKSRATTIVSLPSAGQPVPARAISVVRGTTRPVQGWFWRNIFTKQAAPVVSVNRTGTSAALVTAIVSGPAKAKVNATARTGRSSTVYTVTVGDRRVQIGQSAGGSLYRIG